MTNGFHPVSGEEFPQAVQQVLEDMAAEAAAKEAQARLPHNELNNLRSRLQSTNMAITAHTVAWAGSSGFENLKSESRRQFWTLCQGLYIDWKMANDDQWWSAMHQWVDVPEPEASAQVEYDYG